MSAISAHRAHSFSSAGPKEFVRRSGRQARDRRANSFRSCWAAPSDTSPTKRKRSGVMEFHRLLFLQARIVAGDALSANCQRPSPAYGILAVVRF